MIRLTLYITLAIFLALCAVWLADRPGTLLLNGPDWEVRTSLAVFYLIVIFYTLFCWSIFKLYRWFKTDNPLKSPKRMASRRQKGLAELDLGWSALAVQDTAAALRHGKKARGLLPTENGPLRLLLNVSSEEAKKDYLDRLQKNPNSKLYALKARLDEKLSPQNALEILQEMRGFQPASPWVSRKIFDISAQLRNWADAKKELTGLVKSKVMTAEVQKHLHTTLSFCQAVEADLSGQKTSARDFARHALKNEPSFAPAALLLARLHLAAGDKSKARKQVETTWKTGAHPDLGQFFLALEPMESPSEKFRRIEKFAALNSDDLHSLHLLAKIALETEHWAKAKHALNKLTSTNRATRETYHLLARLEMLQKNDPEAAEAYRARTKDAAPDPAWQCGACGMKQENYAAACPNCQAFGHIQWREK